MCKDKTGKFITMFSSKSFAQTNFEANLAKATVLQIVDKLLYVCEEYGYTDGEKDGATGKLKVKKYDALAKVLRFYLVDHIPPTERQKPLYQEIDFQPDTNEIRFKRYSTFYAQLVHPVVLAIHDYAHQNTSFFERGIFSGMRHHDAVSSVFQKILPILQEINQSIANFKPSLIDNSGAPQKNPVQDAIANEEANIRSLREYLSNEMIPLSFDELNKKINHHSFFNLLALYFGKNISGGIKKDKMGMVLRDQGNSNNPNLKKILFNEDRQKLYIPNPDNLETFTEYTLPKLDSLAIKIKTTFEEIGFQLFQQNYINDKINNITHDSAPVSKRIWAFKDLTFTRPENKNIVLKDPGLFSYEVNCIENFLYYTADGRLAYLPYKGALTIATLRNAQGIFKQNAETITSSDYPLSDTIQSFASFSLNTSLLLKSLYHPNGTLTPVAHMLLEAITLTRKNTYRTIAVPLDTRGISFATTGELFVINGNCQNSIAEKTGLYSLLKSWKDRITLFLKKPANEQRIVRMLNQPMAVKLNDTEKEITHWSVEVEQKESSPPITHPIGIPNIQTDPMSSLSQANRDRVKKYFENNLETSTILETANKILYVCNVAQLTSLGRILHCYLSESLNDPRDSTFQKYCAYYAQLIHPIVLAVYDYTHPETYPFEKRKRFFEHVNLSSLLKNVFHVLAYLEAFIHNNPNPKGTITDFKIAFTDKILLKITAKYDYSKFSFLHLLCFYFGQDVSGGLLDYTDHFEENPKKENFYLPNPANLEKFMECPTLNDAKIQLGYLARKIKSTLEKIDFSIIQKNYPCDTTQNREHSVKFETLPMELKKLNFVLKTPALDSLGVGIIETFLYLDMKGDLQYLPYHIALAIKAIEDTRGILFKPEAELNQPSQISPDELVYLDPLRAIPKNWVDSLTLLRTLYRKDGSLTYVAVLLLEAIKKARLKKYGTLTKRLDQRGNSFVEKIINVVNSSENNDKASIAYENGLTPFLHTWQNANAIRTNYSKQPVISNSNEVSKFLNDLPRGHSYFIH
jgi:hypothetical protein